MTKPLSRKDAFADVDPVVSRRMSRVRKADTKPEVAVRRLAHRMGYRFRLHRRDLPGTPDVVFPRRRRVIQVHGCFWHQHPGCRHAGTPRSRLGYWGPKLARNVERDAETTAALEAAGWGVLVVWECETKDEESLRARLSGFLGPAGE
ncbi:MAG: very short patch repair endonuclease [Shimia sp.]